jgi:hypothetical protein
MKKKLVAKKIWEKPILRTLSFRKTMGGVGGLVDETPSYTDPS